LITLALIGIFNTFTKNPKDSLSVFRKLFRQTFVYGLATVLPRALAIVLVPLYVEVLGTAEYGVYASLMAFLILGNVLLSYGMETAFFRFVNKHSDQKKQVQGTALTSLTVSTALFLAIFLGFRESLSSLLDFKTTYVTYGILILGLDALCVLPFAWYRVTERPTRYAVVKIINVLINLGFNLFFFLVLPKWAETAPGSIWDGWYHPEDMVSYVFIANLLASAITLLMVLPVYLKIGFTFQSSIWRNMMKYGFPVLVAGIAFSINEAFDKILLKYLLPKNIAESEVGVYAACYKLGVFMTLFATAFRLGIEPFFFNHASNSNAKQTYATITRYFTILGSAILLFVVVYIDVFKRILIPDSAYWEALDIVPLILLANLCLGVYHNLSVWYKVTDRTRFGAYISLFGAGVTLLLNLVLIPYLSYRGSAVATLAAYGSMMVLSYYFGQRHYAVPYKVWHIARIALLAIGLAAVSFYVFEGNLWVGTALLLIFLLVVYFSERNDLKKIVRR
jgi:O-antigen/teichoic acid export membrane protein